MNSHVKTNTYCKLKLALRPILISGGWLINGCYALLSHTDAPILDHEMPDSNADAETKGKWLIALCKELVMKYVIHQELSNLVDQTAELDIVTQNEYECRFEACHKTYVLHSRRVRYKHGLYLYAKM